MILSGIASILFALLLMVFPGAGALGLIWLIAAYAIIYDPNTYSGLRPWIIRMSTTAMAITGRI